MAEWTMNRLRQDCIRRWMNRISCPLKLRKLGKYGNGSVMILFHLKRYLKCPDSNASPHLLFLFDTLASKRSAGNVTEESIARKWQSMQVRVWTLASDIFLELHFYRPQRSWGKVIFLHLSVSHSVHRGSVHPLSGQTPPLGRHPPWQTPPLRSAGGTHPTGMHTCYM